MPRRHKRPASKPPMLHHQGRRSSCMLPCCSWITCATGRAMCGPSRSGAASWASQAGSSPSGGLGRCRMAATSATKAAAGAALHRLYAGSIPQLHAAAHYPSPRLLPAGGSSGWPMSPRRPGPLPAAHPRPAARRQLIWIYLEGQQAALRDYVTLQRTVSVDVDSKGRRCRERLMDVLAQVPLPGGPGYSEFRWARAAAGGGADARRGCISGACG
jgi:hypothetical protein